MLSYGSATTSTSGTRGTPLFENIETLTSASGQITFTFNTLAESDPFFGHLAWEGMETMEKGMVFKKKSKKKKFYFRMNWSKKPKLKRLSRAENLFSAISAVVVDSVRSHDHQNQIEAERNNATSTNPISLEAAENDFRGFTKIDIEEAENIMNYSKDIEQQRSRFITLNGKTLATPKSITPVITSTQEIFLH